MDKIKGTRPTVLLIDEHSSLVNVDFRKLEHLLADAILDDGTQVIYKICGKGRHQNPQLDNYPRTPTGCKPTQPDLQLSQHARDMQSKAWGELLHKQFDTPQARAMFKERTFLDRYSGHGLMPMKFRDVYECNVKGADHPSRKREPKGPRGKWGKL